MQTVIPTLKNAVRAFTGTRFHFRITAAETNNALAVIDVFMRPGSEPARHVHDNEDETNIVQSGEIHYYIGDKMIKAQKGDVIFLPRKVPHHFKVITPTASVTLIVTPGGFENFFESVTLPFEGDDVPAVTDQQLTKDRLLRVQQNIKRFGVKFV